MLPTNVTRPAPAFFHSCPNCRSPERLIEVAAQFNVETDERYRPRDTSGDGKLDTHCDAYVGDVTRALGCEWPNWWDGKELSANGQIEWVEKYGTAYGWRRTSLPAALADAAAGRPVVVAYHNPEGRGHVAIMLPPVGPEARIAQAGARCLFDVPLEDGFGSLQIVCYTHP